MACASPKGTVSVGAQATGSPSYHLRVPTQPCPECGAPFPEGASATHPYLGGSAGCWTAFAELGAHELDLGIPGPARLSVHVYTVQHPGLEGRRQAQSVGIHLMALGAIIERGLSVEAAVAAIPGWLRSQATFPWLIPPERPIGLITVQSLGGASTVAEHQAGVRAWADDIWHAWRTHHPVVRRWLDR